MVLVGKWRSIDTSRNDSIGDTSVFPWMFMGEWVSWYSSAGWIIYRVPGCDSRPYPKMYYTVRREYPSGGLITGYKKNILNLQKEVMFHCNSRCGTSNPRIFFKTPDWLRKSWYTTWHKDGSHPFVLSWRMLFQHVLLFFLEALWMLFAS